MKGRTIVMDIKIVKNVCQSGKKALNKVGKFFGIKAGECIKPLKNDLFVTTHFPNGVVNAKEFDRAVQRSKNELAAKLSLDKKNCEFEVIVRKIKGNKALRSIMGVNDKELIVRAKLPK